MSMLKQHSLQASYRQVSLCGFTGRPLVLEHTLLKLLEGSVGYTHCFHMASLSLALWVYLHNFWHLDRWVDFLWAGTELPQQVSQKLISHWERNIRFTEKL